MLGSGRSDSPSSRCSNSSWSLVEEEEGQEVTSVSFFIKSMVRSRAAR